ncbi:hypothetical protein DFH07DRAFT_766585 [Mycena maculata]|uniref:Uncharacterized protein n=1 Tax=Mycena maculata TaxID=230809 RepID=A0AAD7NVJ4_9AGAR|nr:hypothetical protein DFH07DRAFT_766585 [Mycena maculata]
MIETLRQDPLYTKHARQLEAFLVPHAAKTDHTLVARAKRLMAPLFQFLINFYPENVLRSSSGFIEPFKHWVSSVKALLSVFIAEFGMITTLPPPLRAGWADVGARRCHRFARKYRIPSVDLYSIVADKKTAAFLQQH